VASHLRDIPRSGIRDFFEIVSQRKDVLSLGIGEPDFVTPWHIREASIYALDHGATSYTANLGLPELRTAISDYVKRGYGVAYDPQNEILVTVGVSEALDLAVRAVVEPGDEVLFAEPSYVSYGPVARFAGAVPVPITTTRHTGFRLTAEMVDAHLSKNSRVLLLNFPNNPTGSVLTREDTDAIAALAVKHDLVVITDEIYSELTYDGERCSIAAVPSMRERTIFLNGFSKTWAMTGFRVGFSCAPPEITDAMMKIHQYTMLCAPILSQKAAIEALKKGDADKDRMREIYRQRRNFIHTALNEIGLPCHQPAGAFYAFPYVGDCGLPSKEFSLKLLDEENVACVPGTAFGASGEGHIRCSYATDLEEIKEALSRMGCFVRKLRGIRE